jgi:hypothetical protein
MIETRRPIGRLAPRRRSGWGENEKLRKIGKARKAEKDRNERERARKQEMEEREILEKEEAGNVDLDERGISPRAQKCDPPYRSGRHVFGPSGGLFRGDAFCSPSQTVFHIGKLNELALLKGF